jgi:hypothetical protein
MGLVEEVSVEYLCSARPSLICRLEPQDNLSFKIVPCITNEDGCEVVISEGYDPDDSPLDRPVYWRIVSKGNEHFYWTTFVVTPDEVVRIWGASALVYCDLTGGTAAARIETKLPSDDERRQRFFGTAEDAQPIVVGDALNANDARKR